MLLRPTLAAISLLLCTLFGRGADEAIDPEKITAIWRARQDRVKSFELRCTSTTFMPKGSYSMGLPPDKFGGRVLPESEMKQSGLKTRILVDGNKVREEHQSLQWDLDKKVWRVASEISTFNGTDTFDIRDIGYASPDDPGTGHVTKAYKQFRNHNLPRYRMLFGAFRGTSPGLRSWNPHDLSPTGRRLLIGGSECIECMIGKYVAGGYNAVWIDPQKDYLVVRQVLNDVVGKDRTQLEITYRSHPEAGWVPDRWENSVTATSGQSGVSTHFRVEEFRMNHSVPESEFTLKFLPGMTVLDNIDSGGSEGRIQPDGKFKPLGSDTAYELPGSEVRSSWSRIRNAVYIALALTLAILAAGIIRRRVRKSERSSVDPGDFHKEKSP